jgi:hypothetical protein
LRYGATLEDKRNAVRLFADALEFQRKKLGQVLTDKDEDDLLNLANRFGIRHNDLKEKTNYDPDIFLKWMFYYFLNTISLVCQASGSR